MSHRRKRKLERKYVIRRAVFLVLLLALLGALGWGLGWVLAPGEEGDGSSSQTQSSSSSQEAPDSQEGRPEDPGNSQSPGEPESSGVSAPVDGEGDWRLVLLNPTHSIDSELDIQLATVNGYQFDSRIEEDLRAFLAAAKEDGVSLAIISGYRTLERSRVLYENKVAEYRNMGYGEEDAKREAAKWVAPPGTSEHHTGLAMDIVSGDYYQNYSDLVEEFENEPEAKWLKENCAEFGFILRYPKDKVEVTGINFEPWHFRYVGKEHAARIMEQGICLEEYLGEA